MCVLVSLSGSVQLSSSAYDGINCQVLWGEECRLALQMYKLSCHKFPTRFQIPERFQTFVYSNYWGYFIAVLLCWYGEASILNGLWEGSSFERVNSWLWWYRYYDLCIVTTGCCLRIFWKQQSLQPYIFKETSPLWFGDGGGPGWAMSWNSFLLQYFGMWWNPDMPSRLHTSAHIWRLSFFFVSELCLGHSLVTFSFRQLQSERAAALCPHCRVAPCPPACIAYGGYRCPLKKARVWDTNRTKQSRTVQFCLCVRLPFSLVFLNSCRIQVLVICICGATWKCLSHLSVHLFVTREKFTCSLKVTVSWALIRLM